MSKKMGGGQGVFRRKRSKMTMMTWNGMADATRRVVWEAEEVATTVDKTTKTMTRY